MLKIKPENNKREKIIFFITSFLSKEIIDLFIKIYTFNGIKREMCGKLNSGTGKRGKCFEK